jgi:hypothetical protein
VIRSSSRGNPRPPPPRRRARVQPRSRVNRAAAGLVSIVLVASVPARAADLHGCIVDAITGRPVVDAVVELSIRPVYQDESGAVHLAPVRDAIPHGHVRVSGEGRFEFSVELDHAWSGVLTVDATGYSTGFETMTPAVVGKTDTASKTDKPGKSRELSEANEAGEVVVELLRESLSVAERSLLEERRIASLELLRAEPAPDAVAWALNRHRHDLPDGTARATESSYPTPIEVFVVELGAARFTGYVDFDELVAGTVAAEMGEGFPASALRAQAIAARTYALERHERTGVANGGQAYASTFAPQGKSAVAALQTHARVALAGGEPITAFYSARCNGDRTLDSEDGLSGTTTCVVGGLGVGSLPYVRSRPCSGHVSCALTTEPCCTVLIGGDVQHIYGHGVGLCQRGAQELACRDGFDGEEIVDRFYTDVSIANPPMLVPGSRVIATTALNTRAAPCASPAIAVAAGSLGTVVSDATPAFCSTLGVCGGEQGSAWHWRRIDWDDGPVDRWSIVDYLAPVSDGACGSAVSCPGGVCAPREICDAVCERCRDGGCGSRCGLPQSDGDVPVLNDVLFVLQAAVGFRVCEACVCDVTGDAKVGVTDALRLLGIVTGAGGDLLCPFPDTSAGESAPR